MMYQRYIWSMIRFPTIAKLENKDWLASHGGGIWCQSDRTDRIFYQLFFLCHPIPYSLFTHSIHQAGLFGSESNHMSSQLMLLFTVVPIFFFPLYSPSWRTRTDWRTTVESDVNLRSIQRPLRRSASQRPSSTKNIFLRSSNKSKQRNSPPGFRNTRGRFHPDLQGTVIHQPQAVQVR